MMSAPTATSRKGADQHAFEDALRAFRSAQAADDPAPPAPAQVRQGLGLAELDAVKDVMNLDSGALEDVLGVSARTLQRRRARGDDLTAAESDRLWRLLHIWQRSTAAFATPESARTWLKTPHALLDSEAPLQRLDTEPGLREVEDMLTVISETSAA